MVYLSIGNALGVLEQLCARISCRDVGAGGNGSRLPVCTWHGTWGSGHGGMGMLQGAGCRRFGGRHCRGSFGKARLLDCEKLALGSRQNRGKLNRSWQAGRCMASDGLIRLA